MTKSNSEEKPAPQRTSTGISKKEKDLIQEMVRVGVYFGHSKSRKNPKMNPYVYTIKSDICIIDVVSSLKKLEEALEFIKETVKKGGIILFVGVQPQERKLIKEAAKECGMPYVAERWLGGILTNFKTIHKRIEYLRDLEKKKAAGELEKYTKKEQMLFDEEIEKLNKNLGGIKNLDKLPDAALILSIKKNPTVVREARRKKIPIIGLVDTDSDPMLADYPIPSNDEAVSVLKFMLEKIKEAIIENYDKSQSGKKT